MVRKSRSKYLAFLESAWFFELAIHKQISRIFTTRMLTILFFCLSIGGCGFTMRSSQALPPSLHTVYVSAEKPYSPLTVKLKSLLTAAHVDLKKTPDYARFSLVITEDRFSSTRAAVVNANLPSTIDYKQTATISIKNNSSHQVIATRSFAATESLKLNANQIYMPTNDDELKNTLNQEIVTQIYYWLTSTDTKNLLNHAA